MRWCVALAAVATLAGGQQPTLGDVLGRIDRYLSEYGTRLEHVVAEETYRQRATGGGLTLVRTLQSDYALTFVRDRAEWIGYRDTFEVDGQRVRDHDQRLQRLLAAGAISQVQRISEQNAQYNLQHDRFQRTVNTPTVALELLQPRYRDRFTARRVSSASLGDRLGWETSWRAKPPTRTTERSRQVAG